MMPNYFADLFYNFEEISEFARSHTSTANKERHEEPTSDVLDVLRQRMKFEIQFYEYVKHKYLQIKNYYLENGETLPKLNFPSNSPKLK